MRQRRTNVSAATSASPTPERKTSAKPSVNTTEVPGVAEVPVHAFGHEPVVLLDRDLDAELTVERDLRPAHRHLSQDEEREPEDPERGGRKDGDPAPVGVRGDDDEGERSEEHTSELQSLAYLV